MNYTEILSQGTEYIKNGITKDNIQEANLLMYHIDELIFEQKGEIEGLKLELSEKEYKAYLDLYEQTDDRGKKMYTQVNAKKEAEKYIKDTELQTYSNITELEYMINRLTNLYKFLDRFIRFIYTNDK